MDKIKDRTAYRGLWLLSTCSRGNVQSSSLMVHGIWPPCLRWWSIFVSSKSWLSFHQLWTPGKRPPSHHWLFIVLFPTEFLSSC